MSIRCDVLFRGTGVFFYSCQSVRGETGFCVIFFFMIPTKRSQVDRHRTIVYGHRRRRRTDRIAKQQRNRAWMKIIIENNIRCRTRRNDRKPNLNTRTVAVSQQVAKPKHSRNSCYWLCFSYDNTMTVCTVRPTNAKGSNVLSFRCSKTQSVRIVQNGGGRKHVKKCLRYFFTWCIDNFALKT